MSIENIRYPFNAFIGECAQNYNFFTLSQFYPAHTAFYLLILDELKTTTNSMLNKFNLLYKEVGLNAEKEYISFIESAIYQIKGVLKYTSCKVSNELIKIYKGDYNDVYIIMLLDGLKQYVADYKKEMDNLYYNHYSHFYGDQ